MSRAASAKTPTGTEVLAVRDGGLWAGTVTAQIPAATIDNKTGANMATSPSIEVTFSDGAKREYVGAGIRDWVLIAD